MTWRVRIEYAGGHRQVITYKADSKHELREMLRADPQILFAETTGGDGHTANDLILDRR